MLGVCQIHRSEDCLEECRKEQICCKKCWEEVTAADIEAVKILQTGIDVMRFGEGTRFCSRHGCMNNLKKNKDLSLCSACANTSSAAPRRPSSANSASRPSSSSVRLVPRSASTPPSCASPSIMSHRHHPRNVAPIQGSMWRPPAASSFQPGPNLAASRSQPSPRQLPQSMTLDCFCGAAIQIQVTPGPVEAGSFGSLRFGLKGRQV